MNNLEKKVDLLIEWATAETEEGRKKAINALKFGTFKCTSSEDTPVLCVEEEIEAILRDIGVPSSVLGYEDLIVALRLLYENPQFVHQITKVVYPTVSKIRGGTRTAGGVERAIRHAVEIAWDRCDLDVLSYYFGNTVSGLRGRPTNSEFISQMAVHVRRRMGGVK